MNWGHVAHLLKSVLKMGSCQFLSRSKLRGTARGGFKAVFLKPLLGSWSRALAITFVLLTLSIAHAEEEKLKVGFIGSFSGPGSAWGAACRNGFELGLEE